MSKFNKFENSNNQIFLHYNKKFKLPRCVKTKKQCSCFNYKNNISFSFDYPMLAIHQLKNHLTRTLAETEKHNNHYIISLFQNANFARKLSVKRSVKDHKRTLEIFKKYYKKNIKEKKKKYFLRYIIYIDNQISKCEELLCEFVPWENDDLIPMIVLTTSLYAHYHTLKLFETFVK